MAKSVIEKQVNGVILRLVLDDITTLDVDAFVFYAQPDLKLGSGFGNAITLRGGPSIQEELRKLGRREVTDVVMTGGGKLRARHVLHAVGPAFQEESLEKKLLRTIENTLKLSEERGLKSVAFPPMGAGFYGVPLEQSAKLTLDTIRAHLEAGSSLKEVIVCANDARELRPFAARLEKLAPARRAS